MTVSGDASEMVTTSGQILTIIQYLLIKKESYHDEKVTQNEMTTIIPSSVTAPVTPKFRLNEGAVIELAVPGEISEQAQDPFFSETR